MRIVFSALSLLVVLAIVGVLAKKQLTAGPAPAATEAGVAAPSGTPKQQVEQVKKSVENALQQARPVDDTK